MSLRERIGEEIRRDGPMRFDRFMELALYDPADGFYSAGGSAGRRGDFITSPEVGPLFGLMIARYLDRVWRELGEPAEFVVVEAAASVGTLARAIRSANPACGGALKYVLVETSAAMRSRHTDLVELGCESRADWPEDGADVALANELLDNLPARIVERTADGWADVAIDAGLVDGLVDTLIPIANEPPGLAELSTRIGVGSRIPWAEQAATWVAATLESTRSRLLVFDYGSDSIELARRGQGSWLRAYRSHHRVDQPLDNPGLADITIDVPFDQLLTPSSRRTQADWLVENGLDTVLGEARSTWDQRAQIGDLAAIRARSALTEADALIDPNGLGAFVAAEWRK